MAAEKLGSVPIIGPRGVERLQEWGSQQGLTIEVFRIQPQLRLVSDGGKSVLPEADPDPLIPPYGAVATISPPIEVGTSNVAPPNWLKEYATVFWGSTDEHAVRMALQRHREKALENRESEFLDLPSNVIPLQRQENAS